MGAIPVELKESKQFKKVKDLVDEKKANEILAMDSDKLKELIAKYTIAIDNTKSMVVTGTDFLKAKDVIDTLKAGMRSTINPWKACVSLCLAVLQERGDNKE